MADHRASPIAPPKIHTIAPPAHRAVKVLLPSAEIALCCEGDDYVNARVGGKWYRCFSTFHDGNKVTVKAQGGKDECFICKQPLATARTRPYVFGDVQHLDDCFMALVGLKAEGPTYTTTQRADEEKRPSALFDPNFGKDEGFIQGPNSPLGRIPVGKETP